MSEEKIKYLKKILEDETIESDKKIGIINEELILAVYNEHIEVVQLLLSHPDIDVNIKDNDGDTPLHCAAIKGHIKMVRLLLSHPDIDVNAKNNGGSTPLIYATIYGDAEIIRLLLSQPDIDTNIDDRYLYKIKDLIGGQKEFDRYNEIRKQIAAEREAERERNNQTPLSDNLAKATADFNSKTPQQAPYPNKE